MGWAGAKLASDAEPQASSASGSWHIHMPFGFSDASRGSNEHREGVLMERPSILERTVCEHPLVRAGDMRAIKNAMRRNVAASPIFLLYCNA